MEWVVEPEVLQARDGLKKQEVLIHWKNLPEFEATWEPLSMMRFQFPAFYVQDKVFLEREGVDKPQIRFVYKRRQDNRKKEGGSLQEEAVSSP